MAGCDNQVLIGLVQQGSSVQWLSDVCCWQISAKLQSEGLRHFRSRHKVNVWIRLIQQKAKYFDFLPQNCPIYQSIFHQYSPWTLQRTYNMYQTTSNILNNLWRINIQTSFDYVTPVINYACPHFYRHKGFCTNSQLSKVQQWSWKQLQATFKTGYKLPLIKSEYKQNNIHIGPHCKLTLIYQSNIDYHQSFRQD